MVSNLREKCFRTDKIQASISPGTPICVASVVIQWAWMLWDHPKRWHENELFNGLVLHTGLNFRSAI